MVKWRDFLIINMVYYKVDVSIMICTDVDECTANIHNCDINAVCTNTGGLTAAAVTLDTLEMEPRTLITLLSLIALN